MPISTSDIKAHALELGFDAVGFTDAAAAWDAGEDLAEFIAAGFHGDMGWLDNPRRVHPKAMWDQAKSAVILGLNYAIEDKSQGSVSIYAQGSDYHEIIKKRLRHLGSWILERGPAEVKIFVDTAPLMEKPLAMRAGLGWQGKHTNLVSREFGSWLFLGVILTDLSLSPDPPEIDHCGSCRACLDICPTRAFVDAYRIDARRCISYLTIEHKGHIAEEFLDAMGTHIYGCDECLNVCPWNKYARPAHEPAFAARGAFELADWLDLDDQGFRARFAGSPIKRIGRDRFLRNVLIAAGNSGRKDLVPLVRAHLNDSSEIVSAMARRAMAKLEPA